MLINEFNKLVQDEINRGTVIKEEVLFECLNKSFGKIANSDVIHGKKGQVKFRMSGTTYEEECEAADLIIFSFNKSEIRYTLLQNKTKHKDIYYGTMPFQISVRQLMLLSEKPKLEVMGSSRYLHEEILSSAVLDSVGSIGVFHKNRCLITNRDYFDMNYMIASRVAHNSRVTPSQFLKNSQRVAKFNGTINKTVIKSGFEEIEAVTNLVAFEYSIRKMLVGTPILFDTDNNIEKEILELFLYKIKEGKERNEKNEDRLNNTTYTNLIQLLEEHSIRINENKIKQFKKANFPTIVLVDNTKEKEYFYYDYIHLI